MTAIYTRHDLARAMAAEFNAEVTDTFGHDWARVNLVMARQQDNVVPGASTDFHLIELLHEGRHHSDSHYEMERGERSEDVLLPGNMAYVQPNVPVHQQAEGSVLLQQVCIDDAVFREVAQAVLPGDPARVRTLGFQGVFDPQLKHLVEALLEEARRPSPGADLAADLIAQQIALRLLRRQRDDAIRLPRPTRLSDAELARVIAHMEAEMEDVGGIDTLAALIGWDPFAFTRAFKARTGEAPHRFLTQRRIARIKAMLQGTDETLAAIALATGFSSQSHMTSVFAKQVGAPPGRWRRDVRE